MKIKFNHVTTASIVAGLALILAGCSIVAPKYFERKKAEELNFSLQQNIYNSSTTKRYWDAYRLPNIMKETLENAAARDSNYACLKNTGNLCFGVYGKRMILNAISSDSTIKKLDEIHWKIFSTTFCCYPETKINNDSLLELKAKTDSMALKMDEGFKANLLKLFLKLQNIRMDFLEEFYALQELQAKYNSDTTSVTRLENATSAFFYTMKKNKIVGKEEDNFAKGLAENHLDCDLSGYLFIQFGREIGLDLIGVFLTPIPPKDAGHFVVAYRENGKITHYIETTNLLLYGSWCIGPLSVSQRCDKITGALSKISELKSEIVETQEKIQFLDIHKDAAKIIDPIKDTTWGEDLSYAYLVIFGLDSAKELLQERISNYNSTIEKLKSKNIAIQASDSGIYSTEEWEADNKGIWQSIKYSEASDLQ